jgi:subtilisin family serine protease
MNVRKAWEMGYTGKGVVVTILDDGIEKDHPDLSRNYVSTSMSINPVYSRVNENVVS